MNKTRGIIRRIYEVECGKCGVWIVLSGSTVAEAKKDLVNHNHWKVAVEGWICPNCQAQAK